MICSISEFYKLVKYVLNFFLIAQLMMNTYLRSESIIVTIKMSTRDIAEFILLIVTFRTKIHMYFSIRFIMSVITVVIRSPRKYMLHFEANFHQVLHTKPSATQPYRKGEPTDIKFSQKSRHNSSVIPVEETSMMRQRYLSV